MGEEWKMSGSVFALWVCAIASCTLCSCSKSKSIQKIGQHNVIIETTDFGPGSSHSTIQGAMGGTQVFTYESGNCKVRLEGEVLTVNGRKYVIPNRDDSIYVKNGRVEINGKVVEPVPSAVP